MPPAPGEAGVPPASAWLVDKPAGPTSHAVVAVVRRAVGRGIKVGHTGTLDPFATGLLVILVGRATRLAQYLTGLDKTYLADVQLGVRSDTGDPEGPMTAGGDPPSRQALADALPGFLGRQRQRVPSLAAVKVEGERLYARTRRGEVVDAPEREIEIRRIEIVSGPDPAGLARLEIRCSKGTYIRQLAADIGDALGCGAYCAALRRTRVGDLGIEEAVAPEEVRASGGIGLARALGHLPHHRLSDAELARVVHGLPIPGGEATTVALTVDGQVAAVARGDGELLRPEVVLAGPA